MHMNKKEKTTLVPKLRFPEFVSNGPIAFKNGNLIFEPISNKNHNSDLPVLAITQEYGAIPRDHIDYNVSVTDKSLANYKVVEIGDFIISLRSFQGGIEYSMFRGICSPAYIILRNKVDIVDHYYKYYFKTSRFIQDLNKDLEGIRDGKMVSYSQFSSILLPKPDKKEQQKIADCLSTLDDLINAENKKLLLLKNHKKGLMKKLFPAVGESVPEWRFPEFRNSDAWEVKKLDNIGRIVTGNTPPTTVREYYEGDYLFVSPADISDKKYIESTRRTLSKEGFEQTRPVKENSILFVCIGSTIGKIAQNKKECATNQQINSVIPYDSYVNSYIYYALDSIVKSVLQFAGKQAVPIINKTLFSNVKIPIPTNKKEQQIIADCLSEIDSLILAQSDKVESLKQHKGSLIQGLFPPAQEVI